MAQLVAFDAEVLDREATTRTMEQLVRTIDELCGACYGPRGRCIMLQANERCGDAITITSTAARILERSNVATSSPVATLYCQLLMSHTKQFKDHGLFAALFSSTLLREALASLRDIPRPQIIQGKYCICLLFPPSSCWSQRFLGDPALCMSRREVEWSNVDAIAAVIAGVLRPKSQVAALSSALEHHVRLVLEAFVHVFQDAIDEPHEARLLRFLRLDDVNPNASRVHLNTLFLALPPSWPMQPLADVVVALYNISLHAPDDPLDVALVAENANAMDALRTEVDRATWQRLSTHLASLGVTMVLSQKKIPLPLMHLLAERRIRSVERLSITHIGAVQALSGAALLGDWHGRVTREDLGYLAHVRVDGARLVLSNDGRAIPNTVDGPSIQSRARAVVTFGLACPDAHAFDELTHAIHAAMDTLTKLLHAPIVYGGGGLVELELAEHLMRRVEVRQLQRVLKAYIRSLQALVARILSSDEDDDRSHSLAMEELRVGELIAYHCAAFVAGDPRGRRESIVVRIRSDTKHEYPISIVSNDILTQDSMIKRVQDADGNAIERPEGMWRKLYTFTMFPGKHRTAQNASTILKAAMKNVIKDSYAAVYGEKPAKEAKREKPKKNQAPETPNISKATPVKPKKTTEVLFTMDDLIASGQSSSRVRSSQDSSPCPPRQLPRPPMKKPEHKPALVNIDDSPPVKTSRKRVSDEAPPAKRKFNSYLEPEPETIHANDDGWEIPKKRTQGSSTSVLEVIGKAPRPLGANLRQLPPSGASKRTSSTSISETSFYTASPAKRVGSSPAKTSPKTKQLFNFVEKHEQEEDDEKASKSPVTKHKWLQRRGQTASARANAKQSTMTSHFQPRS
ncbi:hypothetical protein SPRG_22118 [Saprolegnia parasitica CBS 223.65]|uniref:Uncharacterized protein n=1 Tax=Saprolegnia parasitica (strain CBS 223.65) TaxID=695850 RepID=A0A067CM35_SAPPC|nr:hypothetical protein SPRG_22118 [Saprolegnia parasitica CBS 223.65]KDO31578.1 hypothetical protein SPRG_22118 [Saprolegnia parasitica CBS 223.65]|eukprot:XP_012197778.1 hypothetical protein SPRG_22118 [Saprolegnia parasitica CBS 223.65]